MKSIYLTIKAKDIFESNYLDSYDCAITRALNRGGYSHLIHVGTQICQEETFEKVVGTECESFNELTKKVYEMYDAKQENRFHDINDFNHTITY